MPGLTGLDLQETLALAAHSTSIVFITGYRDVRASVKAMKAGAVDFLTKPVDERGAPWGHRAGGGQGRRGAAGRGRVAEIRSASRR